MAAPPITVVRRLLLRSSTCGSLIALAASSVRAQDVNITNQHFEVTPEPGRSHVGDAVVLRFRVRLDDRDLLYDTVPRPVSELAPGVRILSVEKLLRGADRIYTGKAHVAFFRTGRQAAPIFGLPFMRAVKGVTRATLTSDSAFVEIDPIAPAGNPSLKDIKEIERQRGPDPRLVAGILGAAAVALVGVLLGRHRRAGPLKSLEPTDTLPADAGPYQAALARLDAIEQAGWPAAGEIDRHYAAVADVLRRYLEEAHRVPALERTTSELVWILPPPLAAEELRRHCEELLAEADLVKFARRRPNPEEAQAVLRAARNLLAEWHRVAAGPVPSTSYALR
jgi:hypothetical protein